MADRLLLVWLYRLFPSVLNAVMIVQPETVIRWHRTGFRLYWRWKSRGRGGRPKIPGEIRRLIREMSHKLHLANPGGEVHDFSSKPFFQAIAAARLVASDNTIPLPHLERIAVRPGEAKDLYFVAIRPGFYPFKCTEPLHAAFGMTGTARIE